MILVFGRTGQVARELQRIAPGIHALGRDDVDLRTPGACAAAIRSLRPDTVINAAAYTAVDRAETDEAKATIINSDAPAAMAEACAAHGAVFVHISSDYVFDGMGHEPFASDHPPAPLGAYGRSKLKGEAAVRASGCRHAILRTSWVFSAHGSNFVKTMLQLGAGHAKLRVVADQIGGPTPARAIARACLHVARAVADHPAKAGTYHFSGAPDTSWAGFAREIMAQAGLDCRIEEIASAAWPTPARRPLNSRLDCSGLSAVGLERPDWRPALGAVLDELKGTG